MPGPNTWFLQTLVNFGFNNFHFSLVRKALNHVQKMFYNIGPRSQSVYFKFFANCVAELKAFERTQIINAKKVPLYFKIFIVFISLRAPQISFHFYQFSLCSEESRNSGEYIIKLIMAVIYGLP
jgi:hypothetical protein